MTKQYSVAIRPGELQAPHVVYFLVDGSSSMSDKWSDLMGAMEGFNDVMKTRNIHSHGIVSVFGGSTLSDIQRDGLIRDWEKFRYLRMPGGGTPLYDAINHMARWFRDTMPASASIVIGTDGGANGVQATDETQARAMLDWCRAMGWQVTFLGFDFNNSRMAALLGADETNMLSVQKKLLRSAGEKLGEKTAQHAQQGTEINFTKDEQSTFGGYLTNG